MIIWLIACRAHRLTIASAFQLIFGFVLGALLLGPLPNLLSQFFPPISLSPANLSALPLHDLLFLTWQFMAVLALGHYLSHYLPPSTRNHPSLLLALLMGFTAHQAFTRASILSSLQGAAFARFLCASTTTVMSVVLLWHFFLQWRHGLTKSKQQWSSIVSLCTLALLYAVLTMVYRTVQSLEDRGLFLAPFVPILASGLLLVVQLRMPPRQRTPRHRPRSDGPEVTVIVPGSLPALWRNLKLVPPAFVFLSVWILLGSVLYWQRLPTWKAVNFGEISVSIPDSWWQDTPPPILSVLAHGIQHPNNRHPPTTVIYRPFGTAETSIAFERSAPPSLGDIDAHSALRRASLYGESLWIQRENLVTLAAHDWLRTEFTTLARIGKNAEPILVANVEYTLKTDTALYYVTLTGQSNSFRFLESQIRDSLIIGSNPNENRP